MPNRKPKTVSLIIKRKLWKHPCVICGCSGFIHVDHKTPKSRGGANGESNLQPLCWQCNHKKGNRLTNEELVAWYQSRKEEHHLRHEHRMAMKYARLYDDYVGFEQWRRGRNA